MKIKDKKQFLEGSRAIAWTVAAVSPDLISAYPITPQTHIVEDLASLKAEGKAQYEYLRAESEFAAASIVLGGSAAGGRTYSATSSQGLLLMMEVLYSAAGLRLPIVMTVANRAIGGPINIWNDHSDAMAMRDAGWIMLFPENHQEASDLHVIAFKVAESLNLPVAVNVDGFIITHSYGPVIIPDKKMIKKFLTPYRPDSGTFLDPHHPATIGGFFSPEYYWQERKKLHDDLQAAAAKISSAWQEWKKLQNISLQKGVVFDNGLVEYYGPKNAENIIIAMGSVAGTIKSAISGQSKTGLLKIRSFRPFAAKETKLFTKNAKRIIILEKAQSSGACGPLYSDIVATIGCSKAIISDNIAGLGGKEINENTILKIIKDAGKPGIKFW